VRPTLQSTADVPVFAAGDIADIAGRPCPQAGVYSVRQGPVLWENLRQWFRCGEPVEYQPQARFLSLLSCGDGTAVLDYKGWSLRSQWMWTLKQSIDRKFIRRFQ
jgi:selenide,water dikinase